MTIPPAVAAEFAQSLPDWLLVEAPETVWIAQVSTNAIGHGETDAIALALEQSAERIIVDDLRARSVAAQFGLTFTGTVGILLRAKTQGIIAEVNQPLQDLIASGFYLSDDW